MAVFDVIYRDPGGGAAIRGRFQGESEASLTAELAARGCSVLLVEETSSHSWRERLAALGRVKLRLPRFGAGPAELSLLCEVFRTLYASGVQLLEIVAMTIEETANPWLRRRLEIVLENLRVGDSLAAALSDPRCARAFPPLMREMVHVGEENGRLDLSFDKLAETFRQMAEARRELSSALLYPAFTLLVFGAVCAVLAIMIPEALEKFVGTGSLDSFRAQLPTSIRVLFAVHDNPAWLVVPPAVLALAAVVWRLLGRLRRVRLWQHALRRRLPVVGKLFAQSALIRFLDVLAANQEAGIPIDESLRLAGGAVGDAVLETRVERLRASILRSGSGLAAAMAPGGDDIFPGLVRQMIRAGEESGHIPEMVRPVTAFYRAQLHAAIRKALDLITPTMIVALGAVVGPIIMGVYRTISMIIDAMVGGAG